MTVLLDFDDVASLGLDHFVEGIEGGAATGGVSERVMQAADEALAQPR